MTNTPEPSAPTPPTIPPPLAPFKGAKPPAPGWFKAALAQEPERTWTDVKGARIETLAWGERGRPGLMLVHGGAAHADWWSFVAPLLATDHRVVAHSWSGMGRSDWRPEGYGADLAVDEILAVAEATGLFDAKKKPVVLGHSFGGYPTVAVGARHGQRLGGIITLDSPVISDEMRAAEMAKRGPRKPLQPTRIYDTFDEALLRFRFQPTQPCDAPYIADHIARHSLREAPFIDGRPGTGWTWRFDPSMMRSYARGDSVHDFAHAACPVAVMWGALSSLFRPKIHAYMRSIAPKGTAFVEIPEAHHHVMVDQPLAFVAATRALLARW